MGCCVLRALHYLMFHHSSRQNTSTCLYLHYRAFFIISSALHRWCFYRPSSIDRRLVEIRGREELESTSECEVMPSGGGVSFRLRTRRRLRTLGLFLPGALVVFCVGGVHPSSSTTAFPGAAAFSSSSNIIGFTPSRPPASLYVADRSTMPVSSSVVRRGSVSSNQFGYRMTRHHAVGTNNNKNDNDEKNNNNNDNMMGIFKKSPGAAILAPFVLLFGLDLVLNVAVVTKRSLEVFFTGEYTVWTPWQ